LNFESILPVSALFESKVANGQKIGYVCRTRLNGSVLLTAGGISSALRHTVLHGRATMQARTEPLA
jgi:hypothetical protein